LNCVTGTVLDDDASLNLKKGPEKEAFVVG
jgi:hypothetical protein